MSNNAYVPPGWYPDPSGAPQQRWWDGTQWSQATQQATVPYSPTAPNYGYRVDIPTSTRAIWIFAFVPLGGLIASIAYVVLTDSDVLMGRSTATLGAADLISVAVAFASYALYVVLGYSDHRALESRGLDRPFAKGWAFLPVVYMIGRSVVAYQRTGRGLAPLFTWAGTVVGNWILSFVIGIVVGMVLYSQ